MVWKCSECGKLFNTEGYLDQHTEGMHPSVHPMIRRSHYTTPTPRATALVLEKAYQRQRRDTIKALGL